MPLDKFTIEKLITELLFEHELVLFSVVVLIQDEQSDDYEIERFFLSVN